MQCGARGEHRDSLLPNTQMLEKKIYGQPEVKKLIMLFCHFSSQRKRGLLILK